VSGATGSDRPYGSRPDSAPGLVRLPINDEWDAAVARRHVRQLAQLAGLAEASTEALATALSEIVHNVVVHAKRGEASIAVVEEDGRRAVVVVVRDSGPGIPDVSRAMQDGYSTANGLGLGLPGARRLVDEFELLSAVGRGTTVVLKKWR
jgi:serine/threonine-protein kinase RsbT